MKIPEKKEHSSCQCEDYSYCGCQVNDYNEGRQDMIDFIPSEGEINRIVLTYTDDIELSSKITKAISRRLGGV